MKRWIAAILAMVAIGSEVLVKDLNDSVEKEVRPVVPTTVPTVEPVRSVTLPVAFTSQAPLGEWSDTRQQDGCEEAAVLMAYCRVSETRCPVLNGKINAEWGRAEIWKMAKWQVENYGSYVDTSAEDTAKRLLGEYFGYNKYEVIKILSHEDITRELMRGKVVITPMDGRKLGNPNFTQPGPERHMVVVIGYDAQKREFITNDPGTRRGAGYRYDEEVYWRAIRDYPTGDHVSIPKIDKRMIVVGNE